MEINFTKNLQIYIAIYTAIFKRYKNLVAVKGQSCDGMGNGARWWRIMGREREDNGKIMGGEYLVWKLGKSKSFTWK